MIRALLRRFCRRGDGKEYTERAAAAELAFHLDPAVLRPNEVVDQREPKAEALCFQRPRLTRSVELLEDALLHFRRHPDAGVAHLDPNDVVAHAAGDIDASAGRGVAHAVGEQIP